MTAELRPAAAEEYQTYFDQAQAYLNCLAAAQDTIRLEIVSVLQDYEVTFGDSQ